MGVFGDALYRVFSKVIGGFSDALYSVLIGYWGFGNALNRVFS